MLGLQGKPISYLTVIGALLIGLLAGGALYTAEQILGEDRFPKGTLVAKFDVGAQSKESAVRSLISKIPFTDREYSFVQNENKYTVKAKDLGASLDVQAYVDQLMEKENARPLLERLQNKKALQYPLNIPIKYDKKKCQQALDKMKLVLERPPVNTRVQWDAAGNATLIPGTNGVKIDTKTVLESLPAVYQGEGSFTVPVGTMVAQNKFDVNDLKGLVQISSFTTTFNRSKVNRSDNLRTASKAIDGVVIADGGEFSFNTIVGTRDESTGYKEAMVILQGVFKPGIGGGICQVSSTLYNAFLLANLPIVERHNHSLTVPYVAPGLDATVSYPVYDLRVKNNTGGPLVVRIYIQGNKLISQLLGVKPLTETIKMERVVLGTKGFKSVQKADPTLPLGKVVVDHEGQTGVTVKTYRVVYDASGKVIKREYLGRSYYKPLDKLTFVGTKVVAPGSDNGSGAVSPSDVPPDQIQWENKPPDTTTVPVPVPGDQTPGAQDPPAGDPNGGQVIE
ncbi:MAG: VanW family protein [Candidatus Saccharibacteria bacterium]